MTNEEEKMSVGVCIINKNGIALAADSAETLANGKMFYNSINKVFSLSKKYPYGAIMCGNLYIYNTFIDQIFKEFQLYLDSKDCVNDFFEICTEFQTFIELNNGYYKFDIAEETHCKGLIKSWVERWGNKINTIINSNDVESEIDKILLELEDEIKHAIRIDNYDVSQYVKSKYESDYDSLVNSIIPELKNYIKQKEKLWEYLCEYFNLYISSEGENSMEILFAGYGKKDAFPKYLHIELHKVVNGKLKFKERGRFEQSNLYPEIYPIAQSDVILTFCKGISKSFLDSIPQKAIEIINTKIDALPGNNFTDVQKEQLKNSFSLCKSEIADEIRKKSQAEFVNPIINSVRTIPIPEMAFLAENLVNITSLKRTYSIDGKQQTVGGPTDVAVLSKGDGFVWIKRKNYFENNR